MNLSGIFIVMKEIPAVIHPHVSSRIEVTLLWPVLIHRWARLQWERWVGNPITMSPHRIRIQNLYCSYFTERYQGTRKYINKDIWIPTHYKQTKTLSENTEQWYRIIEYNVEQKWQWNDFVHIVVYATGLICNGPPGRHRTQRGRHCSETI